MTPTYLLVLGAITAIVCAILEDNLIKSVRLVNTIGIMGLIIFAVGLFYLPK